MRRGVKIVVTQQRNATDNRGQVKTTVTGPRTARKGGAQVNTGLIRQRRGPDGRGQVKTAVTRQLTARDGRRQVRAPETGGGLQRTPDRLLAGELSPGIGRIPRQIFGTEQNVHFSGHRFPEEELFKAELEKSTSSIGFVDLDYLDTFGSHLIRILLSTSNLFIRASTHLPLLDLYLSVLL